MPANDGGPAFPPHLPRMWQVGADGKVERIDEVDQGMTLRDYFAGQALVGMLAFGVSSGSDPSRTTNEELGRAAYRKSDAMLKERERQEDTLAMEQQASGGDGFLGNEV